MKNIAHHAKEMHLSPPPRGLNRPKILAESKQDSLKQNSSQDRIAPRFSLSRLGRCQEVQTTTLKPSRDSKPWISSALALALSASAMSALSLDEILAQPCGSGSPALCVGNETEFSQDQSSHLKLNLESAEGAFVIPQYVDSSNAESPITIEKLNFIFSQNTSFQGVKNASNNSVYDITLGLGSGLRDVVLKGNGKGIQIGQGGSEGSGPYGDLKIDFANLGAPNGTTRRFILDLSDVSGDAFRGTLRITTGKTNEVGAEFIGIFGGDVDGNIAINEIANRGNAQRNRNRFIFNNNATVRGWIDSSTGTNDFIFNAKEEGKGTLELKDIVIDKKSNGDPSKTHMAYNGDHLKIHLLKQINSGASLSLKAKNITLKQVQEWRDGGNSNAGLISIEAENVFLEGNLFDVSYARGQKKGTLELTKEATLLLGWSESSHPLDTKSINGLQLNDQSTFKLNGFQKVNAIKLTSNGKNTKIDLRGDGSGYALLSIGNQQKQSGTGLFDAMGKNLTFIARVGKQDHLGGEESPYSLYGYAYSDRLIVHNSGDNSSRLSGKYFMQVIADDGNITQYSYHGGGSEREGNVAVATIAKTTAGLSDLKTDQESIKKKGLFTLQAGALATKDFEVLEYDFKVAETDVGGMSGGRNEDYVTYFLDGSKSKGFYKGLELVFSPSQISELYLAQFNSLNKRMGDLRNNPHSHGAWARIFNGNQSNDFNLGSQISYVSIQGGYDYAFGLEGAKNYLGLALSYSYGSMKFQDYQEMYSRLSVDRADSHLMEVALYNSYVQDEGWFNDSVLKVGYAMNDLSANEIGLRNTLLSSALNALTMTFSNEVGYRFKFGEAREWFIDPQFEVGFGFFGGGEFALTGSKGEKILIKSDALMLLRNRIGTSLGYDFKRFTQEGNLNANLYIGAFGEMDKFFGGKTSYGALGPVQSAPNADYRFVLNMGTNLEVKDDMRIYVDFEKSFGGKINTDYKVNAGVRYSFGEKMNGKNMGAKDQGGNGGDSKNPPVKLKEGE